jgi:guanylate kinase
MRRACLFIVSGPSGAGKGTLVREIRDRVPGLWLSVSATTREPRPGEEEGIHYVFLTPEDFRDRVDSGGFLEWAKVHGQRYGTLREPVEEHIASGDSVILEIDPQGAMQVKEQMPESILVFVNAPDMDELRRRIEGRGAESGDQIETRLETAKDELAIAGTYDFVVINDDVSRAADELEAIVTRCTSPDTQEDRD